MGYKVKLDRFEGPFDLLVYLIENARMSIYDIKVSEITAQYLAYLECMQQMDVGVSSEFMVLAAELIELKSRMLLPRRLEKEEGVVEEDPRRELATRLLEYKKYKTAAAYLSAREEHGQQVHEKPQEDISVYTDNPDELLSMDMNQFVAAFNAFLRRRKKIAEIHGHYEKIEREKLTAEDRMLWIQSILDATPGKDVNFKETLQKKGDRYDVALSFASILEMMRKKKLTAEQEILFGEIYIRKREEGLVDYIPEEERLLEEKEGTK